MARVEAITGQARLIVDILRVLESPDRPSIRLHGPSGSGKTWISQYISEAWRNMGGVVLLAPGDELLARRPNYPMLLAVASEVSRAQLKAKTKLALEPVTAIPIGGKALREILFELFERKESEIAARTPYLRQEDREILMRMQKASGGHRVLLICDNIQWWDEASIELLRLAFSPNARSTFSFLSTLAVLILQTDDSPVQEVAQIEALFNLSAWHTFHLPLCQPAAFPQLLRAFGVRSALPPDIIDQLFAVTGGHLELVRRIADADAQDIGDDLILGVDKSQFLFELLEQRLGRHAAVPVDTASALRAAAIIGSSFAVHELECLLKGQEHLGQILQSAEKLRILERSGNVRTFVHALIHKYYLDHAKTQREELHGRFSRCLRLIHCGDYARRAEHLRLSGDHRGAGEMHVLECLREMRAGTFPVVESLRDELDDGDLVAFIVLMLRAQNEFDDGRYARAIEILEGIEDLQSDALLAERDILLARCHIKILSREDRERARAILSRWTILKDVETEVWGRAMVYLIVACVFLGDEVGAQDLERELYRTLAARVSYDPTAQRTVNHLRLKSNMLHSVHVARERLERAIEFFSGVAGVAFYDPMHECIGFANLAANHLVEGEFEEAFAICGRANALIQSEPSLSFTRLDILANNLTLAGYLCGQLSAEEALNTARSLWSIFGQNNDSPLLGSNVAYYLARQGQYVEATKLLKALFEELVGRRDLDSYYTYYVGNNLSGSLFMSGQVGEGQDIWKSITPFIMDFIGPIAPYLQKRHELQTRIFSAGEAKLDWDNFIAVTALPQVGPGWRFYGNGFLAAELEYWSDE